MSDSLGNLRAIAHALCENADTKKLVIDELRSPYNLPGAPKTTNDFLKTSNHVCLIECATAQQLFSVQVKVCKNLDTKKVVGNYYQVLRHTKPAEVTPEAVKAPNPIKKVTSTVLNNIMRALCEDDAAKKRVASHIGVLRRSQAGGATTSGADPAALIDSATETELRAIAVTMSDSDENIKKRLLEYLHGLSVFAEMQEAEMKKTYKCVVCKESFREKDNKAQSCMGHPGEYFSFPNIYTEDKTPQSMTYAITG